MAEAPGPVRRALSSRVTGRALGVLLLLVLVVLGAFGIAAPYSPSGWLELLGLALLAIALVVRKGRVLSSIVGGLLLGAVVVGRLWLVGSGPVRMVTLPGDRPSRWMARLLDEQDPGQLGAFTIRWLWQLKGVESDGLPAVMHDAYVEMRHDEGSTPSPVLDTFLGRQGPHGFDTLVVEPHGTPRAGLIFLHGFAGSFALECWLLARAAREIDAVTVCPATDIIGDWWQPDGARIVRETIDYLHARGIHRIFLAGLSNGGVGATMLAPKLAPELAGLILISGTDSKGETGGLPTLVVQGRSDSRMPVTNARAFAARVHATYAEFDGGHFVLLMRREEIRATIARWLRRSG